MSDFGDLKSALSGRLIEPQDSEYERARRVWNGIIDRRPAAIARCATVGDVIACIETAWAGRLTVAIRGGGHNIAGNAVCDGGLVIDLSPMKQIVVDPPATGVYVNYLGGEGDQRVRDAYGPNLARLSEIKRRYDPENFFRMNQNIQPAAPENLTEARVPLLRADS